MTRFILSAIVAIVLSLAHTYIAHAVLLGPDYAGLPNLFRTPEGVEENGLALILAQVIYGLAFVWAYVQGKKSNVPWLGQGIRFGLAMAAMVVVSMHLIYYAVQPLPLDLVIKRIVIDGLATVGLGIIVAYLNRAPGDA